MHTQFSRSSTRTGRLITALLACALLAACTTFALRQGWDPSYGPVVPHDSFPSDCSLCHVSGSWTKIRSDFTFDHSKQTGVELLGAHRDTQCLLCHNDRGHAGEFSAQGCAGCHLDVHRGKLGRMCDDCHGQQTWYPKDAIVRHSRTRFPLIGAHAAAACFSCHEGASVDNFEGLDPRCQSCHLNDLARVTEPDHMAQGWIDDCDRCHLQVAWSPVIFDHPGSFPLSGGHGGLDCTACHADDTFTGLSTDCFTCHSLDYQNTTNPDHMAAGFDTNCADCHGTSMWEGAGFIHSFPRTGPHNVDCTDCHLTPGNYMDFSCTHCHAHTETEAFNDHFNDGELVSGYVWLSSACLDCHPNGRR